MPRTDLSPCVACGTDCRPGRSNPDDYEPGTLKIQGRGLCVKCYGKHRRGTLNPDIDLPTDAGNLREQRIEDIEFLLRYDGNAEAIATRAGFTNATSAVRLLDRWGRHDLAQRLRRHAVNIDVYNNDNWQHAAFGHAA